MHVKGLPPLEAQLLQQLRQSATTGKAAAASAPTTQQVSRPQSNAPAPTIDPNFLSAAMVGLLVRLQFRTVKERPEKDENEESPEEDDKEPSESEDQPSDDSESEPPEQKVLRTLAQQQAAFYRRQFD